MVRFLQFIFKTFQMFSISKKPLLKNLYLNVVALCAVSNALMVAFCFTNLNAATIGATEPRYSVAEYASLEDFGGTAVIRHLNKAKEVAGGFRRGIAKKTSQAFVLNEKGFEDVTNDPGIDFSTTYDINERNEAVGAINTLTVLKPFRAKQHESFQQLGLLPRDTGGIAYGINDNGEVAGYSSGNSGERAVWWSLNGAIHALKGVPNSLNQAQDINNAGEIVGTSFGKITRALLWLSKSNLINLGTLPGYSGSEAVGISDNGKIAGNAIGIHLAPNFRRAVLWEAGGQAIRDLGVLEGGDESRASDVNLLSEVVGTSTSAHGSRAFIWTPVNGMVDLNTLIVLPNVLLTDATGINSQGDVVAIGHDIDITEPPHGDGHEDHEVKRKIYVLSVKP